MRKNVGLPAFVALWCFLITLYCRWETDAPEPEPQTESASVEPLVQPDVVATEPPVQSAVAIEPTEEQLRTLPRWYVEKTVDGVILYEGPVPREVPKVYDEMDRLQVESGSGPPRLEELAYRWLDDMVLEELSPELRKMLYSVGSAAEVQILSSYDFGYIADDAYYALGKVKSSRPLTEDDNVLIREVLSLYAKRSRVYDLKCKVVPHLKDSNVEDLRSVADLLQVENQLLERLREDGIRLLKVSGSLSVQTHEALVSR